MKQATLYRMVNSDHACPFGKKAKALLDREGFKVEDQALGSRAETDAFKQEHQVTTTPQIFIGERRIGGYDDLRAYLGLSKETKEGLDYQPIIAVFAMTALMALSSIYMSQGELASMRSLELFVAYSMCVLAILKLRDLVSFSNQFVTYDVLAKRAPRYAYVYPFAEALVGLAMIAKVWTSIAALIALVIGSLGAYSVIKAVYVDKRDIKCACVGGDSRVPLGFISLTENVMMVFMALWMLLK